MLRALFQALVRGSRRPKPRATPARFAPTLEPLDAREVPAVLAPVTDGGSPMATSGEPAVAVVSDADTTSGKVTIQDISFVIRVSKSSPN